MREQRGIGLIGFLVVVVVTVFLVYLAFIIVPPYYQNITVRDSLQQLAQEPDVRLMSPTRLKDAMARRLEVNNLRNFSNNVQVVENGNKSYLELNYEVRSHVISNIDVVMQFKNQAMLSEKSN